MLVGQYDYVMDTKGRINFPAKYREEMGEVFYVTRWMDRCLAAFPQAEFEKLAEKIEEKGIVRSRAAARAFFSAAVEVTPDKQGRIQLPARLRQYANLEHEVSIIGRRSFAEIWDTEAWNISQATADDDFTALMEEVDF